MDLETRAKEILRVLKENFQVPDISEACADPFKTLVTTVISQSTAETNTRRALKNLSAKMPITPRSLAEADPKDIEEALRVAGLYKNKSVVLKKISTIIIEKFNGNLDFIYSLPLNEARERLLSLPGVGPKTADIILLFCAGKPVLPVDTHIKRVSRRLGLVPDGRANYESIRIELEKLYEPRDYFAVHMLFISLGRAFCRAIGPKCRECPVNELCPSVRI